MKYFHFDKAYSNNAEERAQLDRNIERYNEYVATIKNSLPSDLLLFADRANIRLFLNDSEVRAIRSDYSKRTVEIVLDGNLPYTDWHTTGSRLFSLCYREVAHFEYIGKDSGFVGLDGDHLFDEVELLSDGSIQHRMLFSGPIEMSITFRDFSLTYTDTVTTMPQRQRPQP